MFLRRLSSLSSSFPPFSLPALSQACFKSSSASSSSFLPHYIPAPHPWWSVRGFPPWPPQLARSHPLAPDSFAHRILHPVNINLGDFSGCRSFCTSAGHMMECRDRDRGPPYKRRKSTEEKGSTEDGGEHEGGAPGMAGGKEGGSKREHLHLDSRADSSLRSIHHFNDGSKDRRKNCAAKDVRRENSRDKDVERTNSWSKESAGRDGSGGRSENQQEGHKESQPATHKPWFRRRGSQELDGLHRGTKGTSEQQRDGGSDGGQPRSTTQPPNPWQVPAGTRQPSPRRRSLSEKCEFFFLVVI